MFESHLASYTTFFCTFQFNFILYNDLSCCLFLQTLKDFHNEDEEIVPRLRRTKSIIVSPQLSAWIDIVEMFHNLS